MKAKQFGEAPMVLGDANSVKIGSKLRRPCRENPAAA
jgi:hypothetical protein